MESENKCGFWAVIPASVRYDDRLIPNAKLLYAEITSLCCREGYCWADNEYFAGIYKTTSRSIRTWLEQLQELGYVYIQMVEHGSKTSKQLRRIYIDRASAEAMITSNSADQLRKKSSAVSPTAEENFPTAEENFRSLQYKSININNTCSDACGDVGVSAQKHDHKPERFEAFWQYYKTRAPRGTPVGDKARARKAWNKIAPSDDLIGQMGMALKAQSCSDEWKRGIGIPHAATWLNQHRWDAECETADGFMQDAPVREACIGWD